MADRIDVLRWLSSATYRRVNEMDPVRRIVEALVKAGHAAWVNPLSRVAVFITTNGLKALRESSPPSDAAKGGG